MDIDRYTYIYISGKRCARFKEKIKILKNNKWFGHSLVLVKQNHSCRHWRSHEVATFLQVNFPKVMWCVGSVRLALLKDFLIILNVVSMCATPS